MSFRRGLTALFLFLWLLPAFGAAPVGQPTGAVQGQMALEVPDEPVALQGEWGFVWNRFVDPAWQQLPATTFVHAPSSWNEVTASGKTRGENGWGSYVLQVNCPAGRSLAIEPLHQRTATRLFINGTEVASHGTPGPTAEASSAAVPNRVPTPREFACPLRLTMHVSNFDHRAGGFVRPLWAAPADALARHRESRLIHDAALLAAYFITGAVALIFYAVRRREALPLVFGLFCICMGVYTDMIGERLLLRPLAEQVSWRLFTRIEYLSWGGSMALFLLTLRGLFPQEIPRRLVQVVAGSLAVAGAAVLVLPTGIFSYLAVPGQAVAVVVAISLAAAILRARRRTPVDATVLLAGMLAVLVTLAIDLLLIDTPGPDGKFSTIGFALFMLSPAVVIARRLSHALNAEERNRTLEENARLREDVERMSRHDLKTPLNSILGATRLLRDDSRLTTEQRELVGVLQRSGFRMLEMVNLTLGLFKMETGAYDFRPQAVDLREVVTRVLVDLHSYAEASAVTLHMEGSDRTPVYVRGEELLCYSIAANVVKNAIEAAGPGKRVTVTLMRGEPVVLAVHNPGEVPAEVASRFFEKYVTSGKSGGTGLGTYSARLMARAQLGDLQLHTDKTGTTLALTMRPLKEEPPAALPATLAERPAAEWVSDMPPRDVLVVDDDEYTRLVTRRFLPRPPFTVETAANGQAATEAMSRHWPHFLLLDMEMPVKNGLETVRWVREQEAAHGHPRCLVVMLSGNDDPESSKRAIAAGANRFLVKPVSREALLSTLRDLELNGSTPAPLATAPAGLATDFGGLPDEVIVVDPDWMEVFPGFVQSQRNTVEAMAGALAAGDREDVKFLAHRAGGGLGTMGLQWASRQCRIIERDALTAPVDSLERRIVGLREHLRNVRIESA
jgi:signal transduction histidine kinase/CheY-like chemotaxis protein